MFLSRTFSVDGFSWSMVLFSLTLAGCSLAFVEFPRVASPGSVLLLLALVVLLPVVWAKEYSVIKGDLNRVLWTNASCEGETENYSAPPLRSSNIERQVPNFRQKNVYIYIYVVEMRAWRYVRWLMNVCEVLITKRWFLNPPDWDRTARRYFADTVVAHSCLY